MPARPGNQKLGGPVREETAESDFIYHSDIVIPRGLPPRVKAIVTELYQQHHHLSQSEMPWAVRFAYSQSTVEQMEQRISDEGLTYTDEKGQERPHPLLASKQKEATNLIALGRAISVTLPSKTANISKSAQKKKLRDITTAGARKRKADTSNVSIHPALRDLI